MRLYVLRHGQTDYNKEGKFQGQSDIELNKEGRKQARITAKKLENIKFDKVYVSPLKRAIETAKIVTNNKLELEIDNRIMERSFGKLEGKKVILDYEERVEEFGIETIESLEKRIGSFLKDIFDKYKDSENILVVAHGGVAQIINKMLDKNNANNNDKNFKEFRLKNAEYVYYDI